MSGRLDFQEERFRQKIANSINNRDLLMLMAHQQGKRVAQVRYELKKKLVESVDRV